MTIPTPLTSDPLDGAVDLDDLSRPYYRVSFGGAVKRYFRNYANFTGRASRSEYWWIALFTFLITLIPGILAGTGVGLSSAGNGGQGLMTFGYVLAALIGLALIIPNLALHWRRLHDANLAGPWWFLHFLPALGSLILLVLVLLPPKPEGRRFASKY